MANPGAEFYNIQVNSIDGKAEKLSKYEGKVVLIVNTASKCGYTPQYKGLEALYEKYGAKGLVVLGMPCNQFGSQEPGTEKEIKHFCELNYKVGFPLLSKGDVKGPAQHPLYKHLLAASSTHDDVAWNFEKFLVDRKGQVKGRFPSKVEPESKQLVGAIEEALGAK